MSHALWQSLAQRSGAAFSLEQLAAFDAYLDLLIEANQRMNLTRITNRADAEVLHVGDALTLLPVLPAGGHRVADVGSGGGVPGLVLAIARPDARVTLIESTKKKADFLRQAADALKLTNVTVDARRAEDVARSALREKCEVVVARAVALLPILSEWLLPLVKVGGLAVAMKGPKVAEELPAARDAIRVLGGGPIELIPVELPNTEGRVLVKIAKVASTPSRYPRAASVAKTQRL